MMNKRGFTLVELLVVIAIIAILAAILFPVFARVRSKAIQTACLSNLKQLGMAAKLYVSDYGDRFPEDAYRMAWHRTDGTGRFDPYLKNDQMCWCPGLEPADRGLVNVNDTCGYVFNGWDVYFQFSGIRESDIADPAGVIMFGDGHGIYGRPYGTIASNIGAGNSSYPGANDPNPRPQDRDAGLTMDPPYWPAGNTQGVVPRRDVFTARHNGMCDVTFADGHTKAIKLDTIVAPGNWIQLYNSNSALLWTMSMLVPQRPSAN